MRIRDAFLPLSKPSIDQRDVEAVGDCLRSGWITTGPRCAEFEKAFAELTGATHAVAVSSGTAGMELLLRAAGVGEGDEVLTPSLTFASTVNVIARLGATPVFVDVDYDTLNIAPAAAAALVTDRTRAVVPVHFAGCPADVPGFAALAASRGLLLVEDAAHAVGTRRDGVHAGGSGSPAVFSFHPLKNITTGEGGMVTHGDADLDARLRLSRFHGIERDAWKRYAAGGKAVYDVFEPGHKFNLTDLQAALGLTQLAKLDEFNRRRAHLAGLYLDGLAGVDGIDLPSAGRDQDTHAWHLFVVKVKAMERDRFIAELERRKVGHGVHFPPCHRLAYVVERFGRADETLPETERAADRIVSLPLYPGMDDGDAAYVCEAIREILGGDGA